MRSNKGVTLMMVIVTIILLTIIAGLVIYNGIISYENTKVVKFQTYMKVIQKKVDLLVEDEANYSTLGKALTSEQKTKLEDIMSKDNNVKTNNSSEVKLRYFSSVDIQKVFDIQDVEDEIIVNFANREVISLNGVEKDGEMHYVESGL